MIGGGEESIQNRILIHSWKSSTFCCRSDAPTGDLLGKQGQAVTPQCLGGPLVDRDRLNAHPGLKVSKSNGLLLRNYPSECNKQFIQGLENSPSVLGSSPIGRTCVHHSAITDDKHYTNFINKDVDVIVKVAECTLVNGWSSVYYDVFKQNGISLLPCLPNRLIRTPTK
ncbi:uncharacterized protein TNCV_2245211 [Trichonephila clavipes]|nr:uncharacterized protein TNCV_2245211 [Trichonephila clavipes]